MPLTKKHLRPTLVEFTNFLETGLDLRDGIIHQNRFDKMSITVMLAKNLFVKGQ